MPSKLRNAIGAVKDQTSISLAKVTNAANLEVIILKATTHDKNPIEERYINEIVQLVSSNKLYAAACAQAIGKRIGKTRNWIVALKSLMIVLRIFQDGDLYFPKEIFHAMKQGARILNLSNFHDDSNSSPWDYTAFVRTFALYLDERLDCFLPGKLQRRYTYYQNNTKAYEKNQMNNKISGDQVVVGIKDMKPTMVLDRIGNWQKLLDRAIGTRPTGSARGNRLVQITLSAVVQESFDLYKDISDGLSVVLDNFFHLPYPACVAAYKACDKSYKQFDELSTFYAFCKGIGIGRSYDYPTVQRVSEELMETLQEFLKDQASFSTNNEGYKPNNRNHHAGSSSSQDGTGERFFECGSDFGSQRASLEDLMSVTDATSVPRRSPERETCSDGSEDDEKQSQIDESETTTTDIICLDDDFHKQEKQNHTEQSSNGSKEGWELVLADTTTAPVKTQPKSANDYDPFVNLFDQPLVPTPPIQYNPFLDDTKTMPPTHPSFMANPIQQTHASFNNGFQVPPAPTFESSVIPPTFRAQDPSNSMANLDALFGEMNTNVTSKPTFDSQHVMGTTMAVPQDFQNRTSSATPSFQVNNSSYEINIAPTFNALSFQSTPNHNVHMAQNIHNSVVAPTFRATESNEGALVTPNENDPFETWPITNTMAKTSDLSNQEQTLFQQQQLWLAHQSRIMAKYMIA
ncbi:hypothetical protein PIB30_059394 [Stylosanthes scabra]|uniref:ENTH domain-containing protein n=1 Tax=Stylosanthes scabra TaxID=79078 RepID=A0ABU6UJ10_9FABA|nr:hypothetical protein [Stylosanthes scabra]